MKFDNAIFHLNNQIDFYRNIGGMGRYVEELEEAIRILKEKEEK